MNLVSAIGRRAVYSWDEVSGFLGLKKDQVKAIVRSGYLNKAYEGMFPFSQKDVNEFITKLNAGTIQLGVRRNATKRKRAA